MRLMTCGGLMTVGGHRTESEAVRAAVSSMLAIRQMQDAIRQLQTGGTFGPKRPKLRCCRARAESWAPVLPVSPQLFGPFLIVSNACCAARAHPLVWVARRLTAVL